MKIEKNKNGLVEEIFIINDKNEISDLVSRHSSEDEASWKKRRREFLDKYKHLRKNQK